MKHSNSLLKKIALPTFAAAMFLFSTNTRAQAFTGKGDKKAQVGASFQSGGTGIHAGADFGIGENVSVGFSGTYILGVNEYPYSVNGIYVGTQLPRFQDRFDAKVRFNANLGSVIGLPSSMDVYPGLNVGVKNFGTHAGFRYFFSDGFGVFAEAGVPIAKYDKTITGADTLNNQFVFNIGASFNF